jgi:tripeptidyl-peptidase-1
MLLLAFAAAAVVSAAPPHTVYPEPALPPGWASDSASQSSEATVRDEVFKVTLAVREQNMDRIREMALDVSTPDSSTYGQYLTQAQIDEITAPTAADVTAVRSWLAAEQFEGNVVEAQGGRLFVLTAPATAMGALLKTEFRRVTNAATGQTTLRASSFALPTATAAAVAAVFGVHGLPLPPKHSQVAATTTDIPLVTPGVIASTYNVTGVVVDRSDKNRNRQAVAEFQGNGMNATNLVTFFKNEVPKAQAGDDVVSKFVGDPGADKKASVEGSLDIQFIMGIAPGIKTEFWYYSGRDFCGDLLTWTASILATKDGPLVHSVSYGYQGNLTELGCGDASVATIDANFAKIAARGITLVFASGDSGSGYTLDSYTQCHVATDFQQNTALVGTVSHSSKEWDAGECCDFSKGAAFTFSGGSHGAKNGHQGNCTYYSKVTGTVPAPGSVAGSTTGVLWPSWPASSPWVTSVGATSFDGQKIGAEEVASAQFGSGGGFSTQFVQSPDATWQSAMVAAYIKGAPQLPPAGSFPPLGRATPDVSALGEDFHVYCGSVSGYVGGTSASAPAFAALISLLNEARLQAKMPAMGFLNPFVYKNADAFHDVVKGTNAIGRPAQAGLQPPHLKLGYNCTKGWDPVTGVGTPNFGKLLAAAMGTATD